LKSVQGQRFLKRWLFIQNGFGGQAVAQAADENQAGKKGGRGDHEDHRHPQEQRIGQHFHSSPQYQRRNWFPKKSATMAMPPRKTPKGIW